MDTPGPLTIVIGTQASAKRDHFARIASNIAHNLYLYFGAEVGLLFDYEADDVVLDGNVISIGMEDENQYLQGVIEQSDLKHPFPIATYRGAIHISDTNKKYVYNGDGVGAIYLQPLPRSRLLMIICGSDQKGLETAGKLFPYRTGVGQPDWIVVGTKMGVNGMQGVEAMGYYSNLWDIEAEVSFFS
jgi:hypothetical protein